MVIRKKYLFFLLIVLLSVNFRATGQLISDPQDRLYKFLTLWHEKGYIQKLPVIRPYSLQVIVKLLQEVQQKGDPRSSEQAGDFLRLCTKPNFKISSDKEFPGPIHFEFEQKSLIDFSGYAGKSTIQLVSTGFLSDFVSYSGKASIGIIDNRDGIEVPKWTRFFDEAKTGGGVVELDDGELGIGHYGTAGLFFGTENIIFQAGIMRSSFGPFFDNGPVITPEAPAAGHFSFAYNAKWYSFSSIFLDLFPRYYADAETGEKEELSASAQKYLIVHNARFYFTNWLNLGIIQSNLWGGHFHPAYLIPFQHAFYTQQLFGDSASSIVGLYSSVSLPFSMQFNTVFYVDDWDAFSSDEKTDINGLNFNSAQNKFAFQTGLSFSPCYNIFKSVKLAYLMITPYMYTHSAHADINYLTYTHDGKNIGSILEPNSDQINFHIFLIPLSGLEIDLWTKFTRHGNASEGFEEEGVISDGTVFDDGFLFDGTVTFYGPSRFLTQDIIEKVLQIGFTIDWFMPVWVINTHVQSRYTYQYIWNKDLVKVNEVKHFLEFMVILKL